MSSDQQKSEFPEHADENRRIWEANAYWWDDRIGDGNDFQIFLIEPATERLLAVSSGEVILDIACGAGRFARRLAELGATVVAFDQSAKFVERARQRTGDDVAVEYLVLDAADEEAILSLGVDRFDKAVCTMALMDMPEINPLISAVAGVLKPGGVLVFSVTHPCFNSARTQRFAEMHEEATGRLVIRTGVKVSSYLSAFATKTEGIAGQPETQYHYHRPIHLLLRSCFEAGFVLDGIDERGLPKPDTERAGVRWDEMPEIPPVMVLRMRLDGGNS
ncbi:MAG: class I SAM-dependent methyltransferase [Spirochaetia bacterium]